MAEQAPMEITGLAYGENQEANAVASMAPLAAADKVPSLHMPSQRPDEPETTGSPFGPGSNELPVPKTAPTMTKAVLSQRDEVLDLLYETYRTNPSVEVANLIRRRLNDSKQR